LQKDDSGSERGDDNFEHLGHGGSGEISKVI